MKRSTIEKLDGIAKFAVRSLIAEARLGLTTPDKVNSVRSTVKYPTQLELIKSMIRCDIKKAKSFGNNNHPIIRDLVNITKSTEQFNYLANTIDFKLKRTAWQDENFKKIYRKIFNVRRRIVK